jgi:DNA-binding MarR family transcriptional regulator
VAVRVAREHGKTKLVPADFAGLERHAYVDLAVDPKDKRRGRVTLSEKGRLVRDAYDDTVVDVERRWKKRYGAGIVRDVRSALTTVGGGSRI